MKPVVKKYLNVFQYLQDFYRFRKAQDPQVFLRNLGSRFGLQDKSYLRMIILGKRPINSKVGQALNLNFGFSSTDRDYFSSLIQYTQSKNREQKEAFGKQRLALLRSELDQLDIQAHYDFLSNPLLPRLQVFLSFEDLDPNPKNLA